jgi:hypothetical protein
MKKYEIVLQNKKQKIYSVISWLIIAFNFISFIFLAFVQAPEKLSYPFFAAVLIVAIIFFAVLMKNRFPKGINTALYFVIIIGSWLIMSFYWIAFLNTVLFIFQIITNRIPVVLFLEDRIIYPAFPKRNIYWEDTNNVVLKDGLLTIDLKNNRLFQDDIISVVNETEFNDFCNKEMRKRRPIRKNDNDIFDAISNL